MLVLAIEESGADVSEVCLVTSGIYDAFGEDKSAVLPRYYVIWNAVSQAESLDGSRP